MEKYIYDEKNGLWYEKQGDYYLPCLELPEQEPKPIGIWEHSDISGISNSTSVFMAGAVLNAIPGIVIQLTLIPALMVALNKSGLVKFKSTTSEEAVANG